MKISRRELYDLVWTEPMTSICKKFGLTDNGLRKHCKSMNIPTPPVGYWSKLKHGKKVEIIPLPENYAGKKQNADLREVDLSKKVDSFSPPNRYKERESEISQGDTSVFVVPEVLYAKDPVIIDTKEKHRRESDNDYLKKSPYKSKIGPTLSLYVSEKSLDRALSIFDTVIKAIRFRGHNVKIDEHGTYAVINGEQMHVSMAERKRQDPNSENPRSYYNRIFSGELEFNITWGNSRTATYKDTAHTKLEDKIISIVADLEIRSEVIKEMRIEEERQRIIREQEERERKAFEQKRGTELNDFKSLFRMAERLHKTNILRQYIHSLEEFINGRGEMNEEIAGKIKWAKDKADWLDPFISREDRYMDYYNKDEIVQPECPKKNIWDYPSYTSSHEYSFWSNPFRKH